MARLLKTVLVFGVGAIVAYADATSSTTTATDEVTEHINQPRETLSLNGFKKEKLKAVNYIKMRIEHVKECVILAETREEVVVCDNKIKQLNEHITKNGFAFENGYGKLYFYRENKNAHKGLVNELLKNNTDTRTQKKVVGQSEEKLSGKS